MPSPHLGTQGAPAAAGAYWTNRSYVLGLDPETAEVFGGALAKGQVVLSVNYTFYAPGPTPSSEPRVVRAGAFAVSVDAAASSDVLRRADVVKLLAICEHGRIARPEFERDIILAHEPEKLHGGHAVRLHLDAFLDLHGDAHPVVGRVQADLFHTADLIPRHFDAVAFFEVLGSTKQTTKCSSS